jgi:autotransporter-associated beta strand protein
MGAGRALAQNSVSVFTGPGGSAVSPVTGNWSAAGNWLPTGVPSAGNIQTLNFNGSASNSYISTDDVTGAFSINQLNLNTSGALTIAASNTSNYLLFGGTSPAINAMGSGTENISAQLSGAANLFASGPGLLTLTGNDNYTGNTQISAGTVTYSGNANSTGNGQLLVAASTGAGNSQLNISTNGTIDVKVFTVGSVSTGAGAVSQTAGTVNLVLAGSGSGYLTIGQNAGSYGAYTLSGGALNIGTAAGTRFGYNGGIGVYEQTGGTLTITRYYDSNYQGGSTGMSISTFTGGTLNGAGAYPILVDDNSGSGPAYFNVGTLTGGNALVVSNATAGLQITSSNNTTSASVATLNLNSGTVLLNAGSITALNSAASTIGSATLNLNGATVQAGASNLNLISSTNGLQANIYNGGVVFDTQAYNSTVSANLVATTGNGIYKTSSFTATAGTNPGAGYIGAPVVTVSGGGGTGAQAIANVNSAGQISGFTLTCPGQGYSSGSALTFTLSGGGASSPASPYTYTLQPTDLASNGTAGFTKIGSGTLTLSGANTYTGPTVISAGELNVGSPEGSGYGPLGNGGTITFGGGSLQYSAQNQADYSARFNTTAAQSYSVDTNGQSVTFATGLTSQGGSLIKLGQGTLTLTGASTYNGATTVTAGTLALASTASLGNTSLTVAQGATFAPNPGSGNINIGSGSAISVRSGGSLSMTDGNVGTLTISNPGNSALVLGSNGGPAASLDLDLGATGADQIDVSGSVSVLSSAQIDINGLNAVIPNGTYPLITASSFSSTNFTLSSPLIRAGNAAYKLSLSNTGTQELLTVQQVASLPTAFWAGSINGVWQTNNSGSTNWRTDQTGNTDTGATPDATTDVVFTVTAGSSNLATTLSANQSINSLAFNGDGSGATAGPISISGYTLSLQGYGYNGNPAGSGINISSNVLTAVTINSNVSLGASQTWTNNSTYPLVINGSIEGAGAVLTQAGSGPLTLNGSNSLASGLATNGGILNLNNPMALGTGTLTINGPVVLDNTSGAPIMLNNNAQQWNSNFTFEGSNNLNLGSGQVTLGGNETLTVAGGTLTSGGAVTDGNGGYVLTVAGPGTFNISGGLAGSLGLIATGPGPVNFTGSSATSGPLTLSGGTVAFTAGAATTGYGELTVGSSSAGILSINTTGTLTFGSPMIGGINFSSGVVNQTNGTVMYGPSNGFNFAFIGGERSSSNPLPTTGNYGSYTISGGSLLNFGTTGIEVGNNGGVGVFTQTGGLVTQNRTFYIGNGFPGIGVVTLTGGSMQVNGNTNFGANSGLGGFVNLGTEAGGNATFEEQGGSQFVFAATSTLNSAVNLNHGTLQFDGGGIVETGTGGSAMVNLNGATLVNTTNAPQLLDSSLNAAGQGVFVYNGGVTFNTAGGSTATVSANLQAAAGNGIYKSTAFSATPSGSTGSGYIGAPLVGVTGGSGSGAQVIATVDTTLGDPSYGKITSFTMTNPGQSYAVGDTLTFNLFGGGATSAAASYTYTLTAADLTPNTSGSLTKTGAGTLVLSGSNAYQGGTVVNAGVLQVVGSSAFPAHTSLTIASGAVVQSAANSGSQAVLVQIGSLNNSGTYDIENNALAISNTTVTTVTTQVSAAYANGTWSGNSAGGTITSSSGMSDSTHLTAVGVATGFSSFEGTTISPSDVLVKYTYYGDTDLNGYVDGTDYSQGQIIWD